MPQEEQSQPGFHYSTPFKGLNLDNVNSQKKVNEVSYALNAVVEGSTNDSSIVYQNEEANQLCCSFPNGYKLIGHKNIIEENVIIVFLTNETTGQSEIGKVINCVYSTYINNDCLGFDINDPILEISYKKTNCDTEIYWASKLKPRRFVSINKVPYIDDNPSKGLDCNKLLVNPNFSIPKIDVTSISSGGDNQAGVYQFTTQYANAIGEPYTAFYNPSNPTPLFDNKVTLDFNYIVDKTINFTISNLDTTGYYDYINVAVIKTINNITSVELIGTYPITSSTQKIHYSGQKQLIPLSINDIFQKYPIYEKADGVYNVQDILCWYGMTTEERVNYQEIASKIELLWETYRIKGDVPYKDELHSTNLKGYCRDEIYPYEIVFELTNGYQTDGFTIPGRVAATSDLVFLNGKPTWQVKNTASVINFTPEYNASLNKINYEGPYQYGKFSYWESEDVYPTNQIIYGSLANKPIRHHKFPDSTITHIHGDSKYSNVAGDERYIYPIGVRIDIDQVKQLIQSSSLTQEQKDKIQGFKIVRGNRAVHKSVLAKGIIRNVLRYKNDGSTIDTQSAFDNGVKSGQPLVVQSLKRILNAVKSARSKERTDATNGTNASYIAAVLKPIYDSIEAQLHTLLSGTNYPNIPPGIVTPSNTTLDPFNPVFYINTLLRNPTTPPIPGAPTSIYNNINYLINTLIGLPGDTQVPITDAANTSLSSALQNLTQLIDQYDTVNNVTDSFSLPSSTKSSTSNVDFYFPNYLFNDVRITNQTDNYLENIAYDQSSKQRYTFHSPDTSFYQPALGDTLKIETIEYGEAQGRMFQVRNHAGYKIFTDGLYLIALGGATIITALSRWLVVGLVDGGTLVDGVAAIQTYQILVDILQKCVPYVNYAYQFNAVADYTSYVLPTIQYNSPIDLYSYTQSSMLNVNDNFNLNNWQRESSVYLKLSQYLDLPHDNQTLVQKHVLEDTSKNFSSNINETVTSPTSVYYTSIKAIVPNQWGQLYTYETIDTGFYTSLSTTNKTATIFGGDTFINKFSFKIKFPFFLDNRVGASDGSDIFYDELSNVGKTKYWYSAKTKAQAGGSGVIGSITGTLFGTKAHQLYHDSSEVLYRSGQMFLFAYGIPTFYCESSVNVDLRQAFNGKEGDFYPNVGTSIPNDWLQEINVPIAQDNTYYYNKTFSKQNKETFFSHLPQDFDFANCRKYFPYRTVFSEVAKDLVNPSERNNWLIYKPSSFFDLPQNYGKLTSLSGIENKQVLARFENKTLLYNVLLTAPTSAAQVYLGQSLFSQQVPPLDYADTDTGYIGSQHKFILKTEYGHIIADAKRGQIFLLNGQQSKDLTLEGVTKFFTEFLSFSILKQFPDYNIDNHYKGIGLTGTYDQKYNRLILTKLDYECLNKSIKYDNKGFYINPNDYLSLNDKEYFCNKSFTISYDFDNQAWISFHSYLPNYYIPEANYFYTGLNSAPALWQHNTSFTTFNTFYGKIEPYVLEIPYQFKLQDEIIQSIVDYTTVLKIDNFQEFTESDDDYFNKLILYSNQQCSGILKLTKKPLSNLKAYNEYPKYFVDYKEVLYTKSDNLYKINTFWSLLKNPKKPVFLQSCENLSIFKELNQENMEYKPKAYKKEPIRSKDLKVRYILDDKNDVRIMSKINTVSNQISFK